eukprot:1158836-Pelagomonas_calceolata.AAC.4
MQEDPPASCTAHHAHTWLRLHAFSCMHQHTHIFTHIHTHGNTPTIVMRIWTPNSRGATLTQPSTRPPYIESLKRNHERKWSAAVACQMKLHV